MRETWTEKRSRSLKGFLVSYADRLGCAILYVLEFNHTFRVLCIFFGLLGFLKGSEKNSWSLASPAYLTQDVRENI